MTKSKKVKRKPVYICKHCEEIIYWDKWSGAWKHLDGGETACSKVVASPLLEPGEVFDNE